MDTKVEEAPESPQKAKQPQKVKFASDDLIGAVKKAFRGIEGKIDARHLWTISGVHRFRVNCWANARIQHSEFVHVIEENGKLTVRRET